MKRKGVEFEASKHQIDGEVLRKRSRFAARRAIAASLWTYTRTSEFRTVGDAFDKLVQEAGASVLVNAWRFATDSDVKPNPWLPTIDAARQIADADGRNTVAPTADEIARALNFETRSPQLKLIASACVKYAKLHLHRLVSEEENPIYVELEQLTDVHATLGAVQGIDLVQRERARKGQRGRERTLEQRRLLARESICKWLDKSPHLSGPKIADEVISDSINLSHREIKKLANVEIRLRRLRGL
jgi:hypothetical protein